MDPSKKDWLHKRAKSLAMKIRSNDNFKHEKGHSFWTMFCKIGHSVLAQLARIDDDDEYERSPVNNNSQFELARSHTDSDLELEFSFKNFEIRKYGKFV